jgi:hypothetical protein
MDEAGQSELGGVDAAANDLRGLPQEHAPAGLRERHSRRQAVRPRTDHDRVVTHSRSLPAGG